MKLPVDRYRKELCIGLFVAVILTLYWVFIGKIQLCVLRLFTGIPCPGCGLTRAAVAMMQGEVTESLKMHPLLLPILLILLLAVIDKIFKKRILSHCKWLYISVFVVLLALYAVRMFLYFPGGPAPMEYDRASLAGKIYEIIRHTKE